MDTKKIIKDKKILISALLVTMAVIGIFFWISNTTQDDPMWQYFHEEHNPQWGITFSTFNYMEREVFLTWFGSGVRTTEGMAYYPHNMRLIRLFPDSEWRWETTYNPHVIELVRMWEANGLVGMGILDDLVEVYCEVLNK